MTLVGLCLSLSLLGEFAALQEWNFIEASAAAAWQANGHLTDVVQADGLLQARAIDWDPFFTCVGLEIKASPSQCILIRLRASAPGKGQLFWTGATTGEHGGFDGKKTTEFAVKGTSALEDICLFPFWHKEGVIRQLRLDVYDQADFAIERIAILERPPSTTSPSGTQVWEQNDSHELPGWLPLNQGKLLAGPSLQVPLERIAWISLVVSSTEDAALAVDWSTDALYGGHRETVYLRGGGVPRHYHLEMAGRPGWEGALAGLNLLLPEDGGVVIERVSLAEEPDGPPDPQVLYFGFEEGLARAGRPESLLAQIVNQGGGKANLTTLRLAAPAEMQVSDPLFRKGRVEVANGEIVEVRWTITADEPGTVAVSLQQKGNSESLETTLVFLPPAALSADYPPPPQPVATSHHLLAYYFPGWEADAKWDCIRRGWALRKPLLGYYDETSTECVDWQIKWAVENGIRCFLVDWYWVEGRQSLTHWFEAYRRARYRDLLQTAIMWANHNPPGTHSREDWRQVTREWIDRYFTLDGYYHINGKPAVFIWDASGIRNDLGGSAEVAAALAESQAMAREAGFVGIEFITLQHHLNEEDVAKLVEEGYNGNTSYHEWGEALQLAPTPSQGKYADIAATAPANWERRRELSQPLAYYPVVDTGWDSRPWHGNNATAFHGRTAADFKSLLEAARRYCEKHNESIVILGPVNEWGEGSYIEPNVEFGFDMYEAVREVFRTDANAAFPENYSPRDYGLGPYEFPVAPETLTWSFDESLGGWAAMMGAADLRVEGGEMRFESTSSDPALMLSVRELRASECSRLRLRMKVTCADAEGTAGQLFWAVGSAAMSEAASLRFPIETDDAFHEFELDLAAHPRWRGRVTSLRFDPCDFKEACISVDEIAFLP